jgi:hydroxyacylglutathione hydrolase
VLDTPGHTMSHVCLLSHTDSRRCSAATRCSTPAPATATTAATRELYDTFAESAREAARRTLVYPGHDYIANNLASRSTASRTTGMPRRWLSEVDRQDAGMPWSRRSALEKEINTFFRLQSPR